ncbi:uncharacterized protein [Palaemon carinicauda]|uniref:uncharacterized protein n=1 Tax=Palaemon carinicauda TaxID=392227 RepID=UPI0035B5CB95
MKYGPEFMALPLEVWPISQSVNCELPDRIHVNLAQYSVHEETIIDASKFNNYNMLIAVTARIFNIVKVKSFKGVLKKLEPRSLKEAERFWIMQAQKSLPENWKKCFQRLGPFQAEDGTIMETDAKVEGQRMGQISDERMSPCPAFYHTAVDIFGHFQIKDNKITAVHGYPDTVHSDLGSQLVSASKELKSDNNWNIHEITEFGAKEGLKWKFNRSADAAWQNGVSEALIKSVKRSLSMLIGTTILTFSDLQTTFFEIANLMNERPIGIKPGMDVELGTYLCPNDLLLGRASNKVPSGSWSTSGDTKKRLNFIQNVVDTFWRKWQRDYFPTLIVRQKWHTDKRNVQPGDIVLIKDTNVVRGKWKMGQVVDTETGRDNKVRDVSIRYKIQRPGKYKGQSDTVIKRSVHKLVIRVTCVTDYITVLTDYVTGLTD